MTTTLEHTVKPMTTTAHNGLVTALTAAFSEDVLWLLEAQMEVLADNDGETDDDSPAALLRSCLLEARERLTLDRTARELTR